MGAQASKLNTKLIQQLKDSANQHEWSKLIELGDGAFGKVYTAMNIKTNEMAAVKEIHIEDEIEDCLNEIVILPQLKHKNVISFITAYLLQETNTIYLYSELCCFGSLDIIMAKLRESRESLTEIQISSIFKSILSAVEYLHDQRIIHRDIKAGNILLNEIGVVKLADFGIAASGDRGRSTFIGSPYWMAPEIFACQCDPEATYSTSADIWSIGVTAIELAEGKPPHDDIIPLRVGFTIVKSDPPELEDPETWSPHLVQFIASALVKDPARRPTASQLLNSQFVSLNAGEAPLKSLLSEKVRIKDKPADSMKSSLSTGSTISNFDSDDPVLPPREFADNHSPAYFDQPISFDGENSMEEMEPLRLSLSTSKKESRQMFKMQKAYYASEFKIRRYVTKCHDEIVSGSSNLIKDMYTKLKLELQRLSKNRISELKKNMASVASESRKFSKRMAVSQSKDLTLYRQTLRENTQKGRSVDQSTRSDFENRMLLKEFDFLERLKERGNSQEVNFNESQLHSFLDIETRFLNQKKLIIMSLSAQIVDILETLFDLKIKYYQEIETLFLWGMESIYELKAEQHAERYKMISNVLTSQERKSIKDLKKEYGPRRKTTKQVLDTKASNYENRITTTLSNNRKRDTKLSWTKDYFSEQRNQLEEEKNSYVSKLQDYKDAARKKITDETVLKMAQIEEERSSSMIEEMLEDEWKRVFAFYSMGRTLNIEGFESIVKNALEYDITRDVWISVYVDW